MTTTAWTRKSIRCIAGNVTIHATRLRHAIRVLAWMPALVAWKNVVNSVFGPTWIRTTAAVVTKPVGRVNSATGASVAIPAPLANSTALANAWIWTPASIIAAAVATLATQVRPVVTEAASICKPIQATAANAVWPAIPVFLVAAASSRTPSAIPTTVVTVTMAVIRHMSATAPLALRVVTRV